MFIDIDASLVELKKQPSRGCRNWVKSPAEALGARVVGRQARIHVPDVYSVSSVNIGEDEIWSARSTLI